MAPMEQFYRSRPNTDALNATGLNPNVLNADTLSTEAVHGTLTSQRTDEAEPLPGQVVLQFIRCGKSGCRCAQGRLHGPYSYRIWREGRRVCKVYVKQGDRDTVHAATKRYEALAAELRRLTILRRRLSVSYRMKRAARSKMLSRWGRKAEERGRKDREEDRPWPPVPNAQAALS